MTETTSKPMTQQCGLGEMYTNGKVTMSKAFADKQGVDTLGSQSTGAF